MADKEHARVTHKQYLQLFQWIGKNTERILKERPLWTELANWVFEECGFKASTKTLQELTVENGIKWEPRIFTGGPASKKKLIVLVERLDILQMCFEEKIKELENKIHNLEKARDKADASIAHLNMLVNHLYHQLNEKPPTGVLLPAPPTVGSTLGKTTLANDTHKRAL